MPKYIVFRTVGRLSEEEIQSGYLKSLAVLDEMPGVRWIRSYYSVEEGEVYCEDEAPSAEPIFDLARRAGIPCQHAELVRELEPAMFRWTESIGPPRTSENTAPPWRAKRKALERPATLRRVFGPPRIMRLAG